MRSPENKYNSLLLACVMIAVCFASAWAATPGEMTGVSFDPEKKQVVIKTKGTYGKHSARVIGGPNRLVMDIEDLSPGKVPKKISSSESGFSEIRVGSYKSHARLVIDFKDAPVPTYRIDRSNDTLILNFANSGNEASQSQTVRKEDQSSESALVPTFVPATADDTINQIKNSNTGVFGKPEINAPGVKPQSKKSIQDKQPTQSSSENEKPEPVKDQKLAQAMGPASQTGAVQLPPREGQKPMGPPPSPANSSGPADNPEPAGGPRMVREVKAPVTPPTPDPRLLVQDITELRFIQVGHNSRLMIRGGDHLDYRLTKLTPTKARLDLINAEIPKLHQQALKTDLWSTSVEMIVPGSQSIFIQLKDAVPYQVEKQKGVLMVDFPPPRFTIPQDQAAKSKGQDLLSKDQFEKSRDDRRAASQARREADRRREIDGIQNSINTYNRQLEDLQRQKADLIKRYQLSPDPEVFNKPVTMDFQGISIRNALKLLAEQAGVNIIVGNEVQGTTTLRLSQVPLGQVIDTILASNNLGRVMDGNVLRVGPLAAMEALREARNKEYQTRSDALDKQMDRLTGVIQRDRERLQEAEARANVQEETVGQVIDDSRTEDLGEAGCVKLGTQNICFFYSWVNIVYADPAAIVNTLDCMFNMRCRGTENRVQDPVQLERQRLIDQGFTPGGNQYTDRLQRAQTVQAAQMSAVAQTAQAEAQLGARFNAGQTLQDIDPALRVVIAQSTLTADPTFRRVFIKDTAERIVQMKKVIASLDIPQPQVLVESRMVIATKQWARGLGVQWGGRNYQSRAAGALQNPIFGFTGNQGGVVTPTTGNLPAGIPTPIGVPVTPSFAVNAPSTVNVGGLDFQFGFLAGNYLSDLDVSIQLGETNQQTKIIARPKVQVMNGREATIENGTKIPYGNLLETQFIDATLKLTVRPTIYSDGRIFMDVQVQDNSPGAPTPGGDLQINLRQARSNLIVKDGDTVVIGGLSRSNDGTTRNGWPGLMNVPILNILFGNKGVTKNLDEMLVFLTPQIIKRPPPAS